MKPLSLQTRLIAILLGLTLSGWLISVVLTLVHSRQILDQQIEHRLESALTLSMRTLEVVRSDLSFNDYYHRQDDVVIISRDPSVLRLAGYEFMNPAINLWFGRSQIVVGSTTPVFPMPKTEGFATKKLMVEGREAEWRLLYRYQRDINVMVATGVDLEQAQRMADDVFWRSIIPLLILLPVTTAILILGVRSGLRPLRELAGKIAARHSLALEPIEMAAVPAEIRPVMVELNGLLARLQRALASEQRFTANAAHELQTPLAAIKAEVQRYLRHAPGGETREMLQRIDTRVARATATVMQLLTLARLDPDQEFERQPVDLNELLMDVMAELGGLAVDRQVSMQFEAPPQAAMVMGQPDWLHILVRNLLLNALQHVPSPGAVEIVLQSSPEGVSLSFDNDCEPLSDNDFRRLPERFFRVADHAVPGVGLGLSIVQRIASLHGARLQLGRAGSERGFRATILFPAGSQALNQPTPQLTAGV